MLESCVPPARAHGVLLLLPACRHRTLHSLTAGTLYDCPDATWQSHHRTTALEQLQQTDGQVVDRHDLHTVTAGRCNQVVSAGSCVPNKSGGTVPFVLCLFAAWEPQSGLHAGH